MHNSIYYWVESRVKEIGPTPDSKVLEVGSCDINGSVRKLFSTQYYVGVDIQNGPGVNILLPNPKELIFKSRYFDVIVCTEMLEHAEFPEAMISEMYRVLRWGGVLLLTTRSEGFPHHNPPDYHRFSEAEIEKMLGEASFRPIKVGVDPEAPGVFAEAWRTES